MRLGLIFFLSCALISGCAAGNLPAVTSGSIVLDSDEKMLWNRSGEEQKRINESGFVYRDGELDAYLNEIPRKLLPPAAFVQFPVRIAVIRNYHLNAFAFPNGVIYIHTGLLARMENEAQLATLIAHEMTHSTHRHNVRQYRTLKNKTTFAAILGGLAGGIGTMFGTVGAMASISGFSQDLETEADNEGIRLVMQAGYDTSEAPRLFAHLQREVEEEQIKEPFFFGTHPRLQERIDNYESFLKQNGTAGTTKNTGVFTAKIQIVILDNAILDSKAGRFTSALRGLDKFTALKSEDASAYYLRGEVYRQRGQKGDRESALAQYAKAVALDKALPAPHKGLGMIYYKDGDKRVAKQHFERYLLLAPEAPDKEYILNYIKTFQ